MGPEIFDETLTGKGESVPVGCYYFGRIAKNEIDRRQSITTERNNLGVI